MKIYIQFLASKQHASAKFKNRINLVARQSWIDRLQAGYACLLWFNCI